MKTIEKRIQFMVMLCCLASVGLFGQEENSFSENPTREITTKMPFSRGNDVTITVEEIDGKLIYQGDIVVEPAGRGTAASTDTDFRWSGAQVPYVIANNHPKRADILWAINHINSSSNICLTPRVSQSDYVEFVYVQGICGRSRIGKRPSGGRQTISIGDQCGSTTQGSATHEIMHALGFYHEQSRDDRNSHVSINTANIIPGKAHNFERYNQSFWHYFFPEGQNIGSYDYGSLMHYGANAFGKTTPSGGRMVTIVPTRSGATIGQRNRLSATDIRGVNTLYSTACSASTADDESTTVVTENSPVPANGLMSTDGNVAIDILHEIQLVPQTTSMSCWAAAASMIVGWREYLSINPQEIAGGEGGWGNFHYNNGLPPDNLEMFSIWGLEYEYPQSYTVDGFAQLLKESPLWAATDIGGGAHVVVVSGMRGDGTPEGTILTIQDPWERGMTKFRNSNRGSTYQLTYSEFMQNQDTLATTELSQPEAYYIAYHKEKN